MKRSTFFIRVASFVLMPLCMTCQFCGLTNGQDVRQLSPPESPIHANRPVASKPWSVMGIEPGMTSEQVLSIIKSQRLPISQVGQRDSVMKRILRILGKPTGQPRIVAFIQTDSRHGYPSLKVDFVEDLPDRPGVSVVNRLRYSQKLGRVESLQETEVRRQFRHQLIERYGEPSEAGQLIWYIDKDNHSAGELTAGIARGGRNMDIQYYFQDYATRSAEGAKQLEQQALHRLPPPQLKLDF